MNKNDEATPLLNGPQTVQSIRDTGYKSTDYAIAELIDNSVQARADNIVVVVVEETVAGKKRATTRAQEIWVIDDGCGMDKSLANTALSFGGTDRYDDRKGIGRFGMGLPQASVSQCKRTDVWTWQDSGRGQAVHTYLDLDEIVGVGSADLTVPWPTSTGDEQHAELPEWVGDMIEVELSSSLIAGQEITASGTVIKWSNLDRTRWVRSSTIRKHAEYLLGRIYRRFINGVGSRECNIKFGIVDRSDISKGERPECRNITTNDPLYMSIPANDNLEYWERQNPEWDVESDVGKTVEERQEPLFEEFYPPESIPIEGTDGREHPVRIRATFARPEARPANIRNVGSNTRQGSHTRRNRGISVVRADREIKLETTPVYEATDRWWSVEVSFVPALDEVFGVTNSKQDVPYFTSALELALESDVDNKREAIEEGEFTEDHPIAELFGVASKVVNLIKQMRSDQSDVRERRYRNQQKKNKQAQSVPSVSAAVKEERARSSPTPGEKEFEETVAEEGEEAAQEQTVERVRDEEGEKGDLTEEEIEALVEQYREGMTVQILDRTQDQAPSFFWPEEFGDLETLNINISHEASRYLLDPLRLGEEEIESLSTEEAKKLLGQAADGLAYLLLAWSWMELEYKQTDKYELIRNVREMWGRHVREYVTSEPFQAARKEIEELFSFGDG